MGAHNKLMRTRWVSTFVGVFVTLSSGVSFASDFAAVLPAVARVQQNSFDAYELDEAVAKVELIIEGTINPVADGRSLVPVTINLLDTEGQLVSGSHVVTVGADGAKLTRSSDENDCDVELTGRPCTDGEAVVKDGVGRFNIVSPKTAQDVILTAKVGQQIIQKRVAFATELRPLVAIGVVEGVIDFNQSKNSGTVPAANLSDGLERDLKNWERRFDDGKGRVAGQASIFMKGKLADDTAITAMFDSEKDVSQRQFSDYNPERGYPVMGDSAERGFEAKSSDRLYLRLDKNRDHLLYGDFTTGNGFSSGQGTGLLPSQRISDLGQYNRSLTGIQAHRENNNGFLDAFTMYDSLRQAVEEYRGNGTSGPFAIGNYNALENSDKVEVITRDRNNTSRILSVKLLERYTDYTFEPFSGRILLKEPLSSVDSNLNPVSLRIAYEVDTGGEHFWLYGLSGSRELSKSVQVGATIVRDDNPERPAGIGYHTTPGTGFAEVRALDSVNLLVNNALVGSLIVEGAQSTALSATDELNGSAIRFDWAKERKGDNVSLGSRWDIRLFGGVADQEFINPSSSLAPGRTEIGLQSKSELGERTRVNINGNYTEDSFTTRERGAVSVGLERDLTARTQAEVGVRSFYRRNGGVASLSQFSGSLVLPGQAPAYGGTGLNPNGAGFWGLGVGLDPVTGQPQNVFNGSPIYSGLPAQDLDVTTYTLGLNTRIRENWSVAGEVGSDQGYENDPTWYALRTDYRYGSGRIFARAEVPTGRGTAGADYQFSKTISMYGRWEQSNGLGSVYSIDDAPRSQAFVAGVRRHDEEGSDLHSELRLRDGMNNQELEAATGLSNTIPISSRVNANYLVERLEILDGPNRSAAAVGGGLEFGDKTWQGNSRLELRQLDRDHAAILDNTARSLMGSVSFARKLNGDWTGLIRNYALLTDDLSQPGSQLQNRFQIGAAYRPRFSTQFDLLFRYENKRETNNELEQRERRNVDIVSTHLNWHPYRQLWLSGRIAAKDLDETIVGVADHYQAWLASARLIYDISERFDVGFMGSLMGSPDSDVREKAYGVELGFRAKDNIWLSAGHNFAGFTDRDLTGGEQTEKGWYIRLRMKFDEKFLAPLINKLN